METRAHKRKRALNSAEDVGERHVKRIYPKRKQISVEKNALVPSVSIRLVRRAEEQIAVSICSDPKKKRRRETQENTAFSNFSAEKCVTTAGITNLSSELRPKNNKTGIMAKKSTFALNSSEDVEERHVERMYPERNQISAEKNALVRSVSVRLVRLTKEQIAASTCSDPPASVPALENIPIQKKRRRETHENTEFSNFSAEKCATTGIMAKKSTLALNSSEDVEERHMERIYPERNQISTEKNALARSVSVRLVRLTKEQIAASICSDPPASVPALENIPIQKKRRRETHENTEFSNFSAEKCASTGIMNAAADEINLNKRKQPSRAAKRVSVQLLKEKANEEKANVKKKLTRDHYRKQLEKNIYQKAPINEYLEGEIVLGTIPGYAPWPARIIKIVNETMYIQFFGTGQVNPVRLKAIQRFDINRVIPLLERKGYKKAMRELEMTLRIPDTASIFNKN